MRVSLKDVAERAGVSIKTVSNVVNKYQHVTPAMRARVQQAIDELGYRPNLTARHLRKGRTGIIALAVPELGNPYFAELAGAVIDAAAAHDFTVLLDHTRGDREQEVLVSQGFRARVIDGLILSPLELEAEDLRGREADVPLVLLGEREYDLPYDHIAIDNVAAARDAGSVPCKDEVPCSSCSGGSGARPAGVSASPAGAAARAGARPSASPPDTSSGTPSVTRE